MISNWFLRLGVLFALIGMGLGIVMAASHDHSQMPVHAHVNLLGWVSMFIAGLFYRAFPSSQTRLASIHLGLSVIGLVMMSAGLSALLQGMPGGEPFAAIGSIIILAGALLFAAIVFKATSASQA